MNQFYTRKQAMERLGIRSTNAFTQLVKNYPDAFILIKEATSKYPRYDKTTLDKFAELRDSLQSKVHFRY